MKRIRIGQTTAGIALVFGLILALAGPALAQSDGLRLSWNKDWGYSLGGKAQGLFTLSASGPQGMIAVRFMIDGNEITTVNQPPFAIKVSTDKYALGRHWLSAVGQMPGGQTLNSNPVEIEFISPDSTLRAVGLVLAVVIGLAILSSVGPALLTGKSRQHPEPGAPRNYGVSGGAICQRCGRPFARSFAAPNLLVGKLERCPSCGKWQIARRASPQELAAAEAAEVTASQPAVPEASSEERLRRQVEESKYSDF